MAENKIHTTNYFNTFIAVAEDCVAICGFIPTSKNDKKSIAEWQYEIVAKNPYEFTSDEVLFQIYAERNDLKTSDYESMREVFFSKGQACLRASPLAKKFGFGIHFDDNGKIAIYGVETVEYQNFMENNNTKKVKAMRSSKK